MISKLHAAARAYAKAGWPIFPICINAKNPACPNGVHDATTDLTQIDEWWNAGDWNIGFCPEGAGMCVVDEDTDKGGHYDATTIETVRTPHGRHFYYSGSLPPTSNKLAPHIDTRGRSSYVLVPPSIVDGFEYRATEPQFFPLQDYECSELPDWVKTKCETNAQVRDRSENIKGDAVDRPAAIKVFKRYLERNPIPPEGAGSDDAVYRAIARGRDLGLSDSSILGIIWLATGFDEEWIEGKLINVETYGQNEPGCDTPETGDEKWGGFARRYVSATESEEGITEADRDAWTPHDPRDPATMSELSFYDTEGMIPHSPEGAIGIIYGKRGDHKTNTILSMLSDTCADRILYAAGEGAYGVERDRISARPSLAGRIKILPRVPAFANPDDVRSFLNGCNRLGWEPEIIVLDTLATVLAGEDEQTAVTASYLTDNGPAGIIKREWNSTVIFIAHAGKDVAKGVRGSSGFEANADFVILVEADKDLRAIKCTCTKMRDGYDGHSTYWTYDATGVPVPRQISEEDYLKLIKPKETDDNTPIAMMIVPVLRSLKAYTFGTGLTRSQLADAMTEYELGPKPEDDDDHNGRSPWATKREQWYRSLNNAKRKAWAKKYYEEAFEFGSDKKEMVLKWFVPQEDHQDEM